MKCCFIFLTGLFAVSSALAQSSTPQNSTEKLATVDGQAITDAELEPLVQGQMRPLRDQEYQIKRKALDSLITQRLLEAEAKKKGVTADKFLEQEVALRGHRHGRDGQTQRRDRKEHGPSQFVRCDNGGSVRKQKLYRFASNSLLG